ncbi:hypothetical protein AG0111_0g7134 [Alternaria gaisen]|uniref:Uncharacterized protein n=1 Tax=Alternaria gaisen TaxID=167740 RepID=A0ACB6FJZ9_9PLEO|nr:hypothetical protein AG0111_0g7134 [Alternaria gaisen]
MADTDPTWHPPQILEVRHLRERGRARGQVQVSAPRTPKDHQAGHNLVTQDRQRSSDHLRYEAQSTPYWDNANGAIHNIPSALSRNSVPPHAQTMSGETRETKYREPNTRIQVPPRAAFNNPYLDIVGDGPYERNQAMYTAAGMAEAESIGERTRRRDFTPYFDAADARNGMDLCSSDKEGFRHALAKKDMNQKLRQDTIETMKAATAKRGTGHTERTSEPRVPLRASNEIRHPTTPKFKSKFAIPASPKTPRAIAVPASGPKKAEFQRKSAEPKGLDMSKIGAGKEESNDGNELQQAPREKSLDEAQMGLSEYFNVPLETIGIGKADAQTPQTSSSQNSFTTASTGNYERVGSREKLGQEQNGMKRRWYRGFRKV